MKTLAIALVICALPLLAVAEKMAVTIDDEQRRIVLNDDGTWAYADTTTVRATSDAGFHFRKTRWGMSREQVTASESSGEAQKFTNGLIYKDVLATHKVLVAYIFVTDKLVRTKYIIDEKHSNKTEFYLDYKSLQKLLIAKYGEPSEDETVWLDDLYQDKPDSWGLAASIGHVTFYTQWDRPETSIFLFLNGDNYKIEFGIEYSSINLGQLEKQAKQAEALDGL